MAPDEFARFYRSNLPRVYGYLLRLCADDHALAEDLTQDTWMALARELARGHDDCADIRWLFTVARSRFLDHVRRQNRASRNLHLVASDERSVDEPGADEVIGSLAALSPLHRLVLVLRYVEDLDVPRIADTLGRNVTATNSLLARARTELRIVHGRLDRD